MNVPRNLVTWTRKSLSSCFTQTHTLHTHTQTLVCTPHTVGSWFLMDSHESHNMHTYRHTYTHAYIHTSYIHTDIHACIHIYKHT
jgi:hypothetical protein